MPARSRSSSRPRRSPPTFRRGARPRSTRARRSARSRRAPAGQAEPGTKRDAPPRPRMACGLQHYASCQARIGAARPLWRSRDKEVAMLRSFARHLPLTFLIPLTGLAQPIQDAEVTPLSMEEVVVTGTASAERTKYESSVAITTFEAEDLRREAPQSTADLLESVPGFWVESTSGTTQGNVFARGIIQDGGYRYVGLME